MVRSPLSNLPRRTKKRSRPIERLHLVYRQRPTLPHSPPCSTIGAGGLNCRVRNGNGCCPSAVATGKFVYSRIRVAAFGNKPITLAPGQAARPISTSRLNVSLRLHLWPINLVIYKEPSVQQAGGISSLGVGFALRCFQRLSLPNIATQRCPWRDNWYTRGSSVRVLSYCRQLPSNILRPRRIGTELSHDVLNPAHVPL
jgi:hypothetical protein